MNSSSTTPAIPTVPVRRWTMLRLRRGGMNFPLFAVEGAPLGFEEVCSTLLLAHDLFDHGFDASHASGNEPELIANGVEFARGGRLVLDLAPFEPGHILAFAPETVVEVDPDVYEFFRGEMADLNLPELQVEILLSWWIYGYSLALARYGSVSRCRAEYARVLAVCEASLEAGRGDWEVSVYPDMGGEGL